VPTSNSCSISLSPVAHPDGCVRPEPAWCAAAASGHRAAQEQLQPSITATRACECLALLFILVHSFEPPPPLCTAAGCACNHLLQPHDILRMERIILNVLEFRLVGPTCYTFLHLLAQVGGGSQAVPWLAHGCIIQPSRSNQRQQQLRSLGHTAPPHYPQPCSVACPCGSLLSRPELGGVAADAAVMPSPADRTLPALGMLLCVCV
jgi:hypothetical protein